MKLFTPWYMHTEPAAPSVVAGNEAEYHRRPCARCYEWKSAIRATAADKRNKIHQHTSRIRQSWQTHKGGDMDQEDRQDESRRGELPVEPSFYILMTGTGSQS